MHKNVKCIEIDFLKIITSLLQLNKNVKILCRRQIYEKLIVKFRPFLTFSCWIL